MRVARRGCSRGLLVAAGLLIALGTACGGAPAEQDWYYHWDCHGDPDCLSRNPTGEPSGTRNEGPVEVNCTQLMEFSRRFWNMPPATDACDHSPTTPVPPPPVPTIATFTPGEAVEGTPITLSGGGFPGTPAGVTVTVGGVVAPVTSALPNQLVFPVPALPPGSYPVVVTTAGGTATAASLLVVRDPVLTVTTSGDGAVVSTPAGIDCRAGSGTCSAAFPHGTAISLRETAGPTAAFSGWTGAGCSGAGTTCGVTLLADAGVTASFQSETLTVALSGTGRVVSSPPGIDCTGPRSACTAAFPPGTSVTLTETPGPVATFGGWSGGGCAGTASTCTLTLDANVTVSAPFLTSTLVVVPVALNGTSGTGTVTSVPAGIDCAGTSPGSAGCSASFAGGTQVTLTATPAAGSTLASWSGAGCTGSDPCVVVLDGNSTVTAQYCVPHGTATYATPGTFTHVACAATLTVQAWGAGGGGGAEASRFGTSSGSGGGGGGYGAGAVSVVPGAAHAVTVGAGGTGGWGYDHGAPDPATVPCSGGANGPGGPGGASAFADLLVASGGGGGTYGAGAGGTGGTSGAPTSVAGAAGATGGTAQGSPAGNGGVGGNGGAGGEGGASVPYGTVPPAGTHTNGNPGSPPGGGGGGGGWNNFFCYDGAAGGSGKVVVDW